MDKDMWEKIVLNLLSNALKFTMHGHIKISIKTVSSTVPLFRAQRRRRTMDSLKSVPRCYDRRRRSGADGGGHGNRHPVGGAATVGQALPSGPDIRWQVTRGNRHRYSSFITQAPGHYPDQRRLSMCPQGWRWCTSWSGCTGARSRSPASLVRVLAPHHLLVKLLTPHTHARVDLIGSTFRVCIPFGAKHLPKDQIKRVPWSSHLIVGTSYNATTTEERLDGDTEQADEGVSTLADARNYSKTASWWLPSIAVAASPSSAQMTPSSSDTGSPHSTSGSSPEMPSSPRQRTAASFCVASSSWPPPAPSPISPDPTEEKREKRARRLSSSLVRPCRCG